MQHKFAVGERVAFTRPGGWRFGVDDVYLVMRQLPGTEDEPGYVIKHAGESHLRSARESELRAAADPARRGR
jgi:hypothetical protein